MFRFHLHATIPSMLKLPSCKIGVAVALKSQLMCSSYAARANSCPESDDAETDYAATVDDAMSSTCRLNRASWKSLSSVTLAKSKTAKVRKSSHTISLPKIYNSKEEAISSTSTLVIDSREESLDQSLQPELDCTEYPAEILISALYSASVSSFTITVIGIVNLPRKMESRSVYVRGIVRPKHSEFQLTKPKEGCSPEINESFHFHSLRPEEMSSSHLTLTVHKASNNKAIAELFIILGSFKIENGVTGHFKYPLTPAGHRSKRVSPTRKNPKYI